MSDTQDSSLAAAAAAAGSDMQAKRGSLRAVAKGADEDSPLSPTKGRRGQCLESRSQRPVKTCKAWFNNSLTDSRNNRIKGDGKTTGRLKRKTCSRCARVLKLVTYFPSCGDSAVMCVWCTGYNCMRVVAQESG